jgi:hypothetical protein
MQAEGCYACYVRIKNCQKYYPPLMSMAIHGDQTRAEGSVIERYGAANVCWARVSICC